MNCVNYCEGVGQEGSRAKTARHEGRYGGSVNLLILIYRWVWGVLYSSHTVLPSTHPPLAFSYKVHKCSRGGVVPSLSVDYSREPPFTEWSV